jgi:hypothetical protein
MLLVNTHGMVATSLPKIPHRFIAVTEDQANLADKGVPFQKSRTWTGGTAWKQRLLKELKMASCISSQILPSRCNWSMDLVNSIPA